jgi:hypothetical protein
LNHGKLAVLAGAVRIARSQGEIVSARFFQNSAANCMQKTGMGARARAANHLKLRN